MSYNYYWNCFNEILGCLDTICYFVNDFLALEMLPSCWGLFWYYAGFLYPKIEKTLQGTELIVQHQLPLRFWPF